MQREIENLKKQKDEKLENLQQENENLKKEHEKEITLLKKEVMELKEKLNAKLATNENLNFVHETVINPREFQQEYFMNTEITIKEEPIE